MTEARVGFAPDKCGGRGADCSGGGDEDGRLLLLMVVSELEGLDLDLRSRRELHSPVFYIIVHAFLRRNSNIHITNQYIQ